MGKRLLVGKTLCLGLGVLGTIVGCETSSVPMAKPAGPTATKSPVQTATASAPAIADPNQPMTTPAVGDTSTKPAAPMAEAALPTAPAAPPATIAEAAKVIDMRTFPRVPGAMDDADACLASVNYSAPGKAVGAFKFLQEKFLASKWKELPGGYASEEGASGTFARDGFLVSASVYADTSDPKTAKVRVSLTSHGNVNLQQLPAPEGVKPLYQFPTSIAYVTETAPAEMKAAVTKLLTDKGWEPYDQAGDTLNFKQNAVLVAGTIAAAPGQGGKTVITYGSHLLSADIPLPPNTIGAQYSDGVPAQLFFDIDAEYDVVAKFYRERLAKAGWKATTDNYVKIDWKSFLIFRNPEKDLMELELSTFEGKTRAHVRFQTAEYVAAMEAAAKEALARKNAKKNDSPAKPKLAIKLPADAAELEASASSIEFKVAPGKAKATVEGLQKQLVDAGWKAESVTYEDLVGNVVLKKGDESITLTYLETGVLPPEVTITSFGIDLTTSK